MDTKVMELKMKQWIPIFEAQAQSGMGKEKWCDANGIKRWDFFKWQREIRKFLPPHNTTEPVVDTPCLPAGTGFVDITPTLINSTAMADDEPEPVANASANPVSSIAIRYGGFTVDLAGGIDKKLLSTVLKVLRDVD